MSALDDFRHYMRLPMCGYCINAWDIIYQRMRPGLKSPQEWLAYCHVGGCDPDVWNFLDEETGWPHGFVFLQGGRVDWQQTLDDYEVPAHDDTVYHRRANNGEAARWRKVMPKLVDAWWKTKGGGRYENGVVKDEDIDWGDVEFEDDAPADVEFVPDDEIEW
jgi:hypothetical protein